MRVTSVLQSVLQLLVGTVRRLKRKISHRFLYSLPVGASADYLQVDLDLESISADSKGTVHIIYLIILHAFLRRPSAVRRRYRRRRWL